MKVTGYKLREAIRRWELRRKATASQFDDSLHAFEGDEKITPTGVIKTFERSDRAIAELQTAQARYNLVVTARLGDEELTLCELVKLVGGAGRVEKMWRSAALIKKDRYSYRGDELTRDPNEVRAKRTISHAEATQMAIRAAKKAGDIRAGIATANATEVEIEGLSADLFE